jgi:hypothetical protein
MMRSEGNRSSSGGEAAPEEAPEEKPEGAADPFQKEGETFETGKIRRGVIDIPEVAAYAKRIGAEQRGLRKLVVFERTGKYSHELAVIRLSETGEVSAPEDYEPSDVERAAITKAWSRYTWPAYQPHLYTARHLPRHDDRFPWSKADPANLAVCWDRKREHILCVEVRIPQVDGGKIILIWSPFDDAEWRIAEPDPLPLFGLEGVADASTIFVHEGPKAAKAAQQMLDNDGVFCPKGGWRAHPWGPELRTEGKACHVAFLGGAARPQATDWTPVRECSARVIAVPDNDDEGREAVKHIARAVGREMWAVKFDERFEPGFDLADDMPEVLFDRTRPSGKQYVGPALRDLMRPATWATAPVARGVDDEGRRQRGQAGFRIVPQFAKQWLYIEGLDVFVNRRDPRTFFDEKPFNNTVRPFSEVKDTAALMHKLWSVKVDGFAYQPGEPEGVISIGKKRLLNLHVGSGIEPTPGDPRPFLRFLRDFLPNRQSRRHVERWIATLIARPDIRILYALLLVSKTQGVGKNTLVHIVRMLVGLHNCSSTTAKEITGSAFNTWIAEKRLVEVDEVYAGHSSELANTIKPLITGTEVPVNRKFKEPYNIANWAHFVLMSNSRLPLFVEEQDRRWLVPEVTEAVKPPEYWAALHRWLQDGGLAIIAHWAERFMVSNKRRAVKVGAHAPRTAAKEKMIEASRSGAERQLREISEFLLDLGKADPPQRVILPIAVLMAWFRSRDNLSLGDRKISERAVLDMLPESLHVCKGDQRCDTGGRKHAVIINFVKEPEDKWPALVREGCLWNLKTLTERFDAF